MMGEAPLKHLKLTHFLRGLDDQALLRLADQLEIRPLSPGQTLLSEGEHPTGLMMLMEGRVEVVTTGAHGERRTLAEEEAGALLGAGELLGAHPARVSLVTLDPGSVLFWQRDLLFPFLEAHPAALESLQLAAASQELSRTQALDWLATDEGVFAFGRRHLSRLVLRMAIPALVLCLAAGLFWFGLGREGSLFLWLGGLAALLGLLLAVWQWLDWENDYFIVTDQRVVWLEKVIALYDSRIEAPLHQVLAVSVQSDVLGRWLGYGKVIIRTYTGQIDFEQIGRPRAVAAVIEERWRRQQIQDHETDRDEKLSAVRQILEQGPLAEPDLPPSPPPVADPEETPTGSSEIGLNHWNLDLRFEDRGVIVYRKHWAVLLGSIALPSIALLFLVGAIGARLGGLLPSLEPSTFWVAAVAAAIGISGWWFYRFADWANDLYQVSPTHILDVYRRPLGRELRRAAPLENILSTEVERRGLIGLMLDFGDVRVSIGDEQLDFEGVFHPASVQQDIVRAQEAFLAKKRLSDKEQRREEMVEWLGAYHEEMAAQKQKPPDEPDFDVYP